MKFINRSFHFKHLISLLFLLSVSHPIFALEKILDVNGTRNIDTTADGRFIIYDTLTDGANSFRQLYYFDRDTGENRLISVNNRGEMGNHHSFMATVTPDGRYVVFASTASNLIDNDQTLFEDNSLQTGRDIYLHDLQTGTTELVSKSTKGVQGNDYSSDPDISDDGRYIVYSSEADNLAADDMKFEIEKYDPITQTYITVIQNIRDTFMYDRVTGETIMVNLTERDLQVGGAFTSAISGDGSTIAFTSGADYIEDGITQDELNGQVYLKDRVSGNLEFITKTSEGQFGDETSGLKIAISENGDFVAYTTRATNIVSFPTAGLNFFNRAILYDRQQDSSLPLSLDGNNNELDDVVGLDITPDGSHVAFLTNFSDAGIDPPAKPRAFIYDRVNASLTKADNTGFENEFLLDSGIAISISNDGSEILFNQGIYGKGRALVSFPNPNSKNIKIVKTINGELIIPGSEEPVASLLAGRPYRADYRVTNTSSKRIYGIKVFDDDQGSNQLACNLYALNPGQTARCHRIYQVQTGLVSVPARVEARVSGDGTVISAATPRVRYVGKVDSGELTMEHALNDKPGDDEASAVMLSATAEQSWLFKVTNSSSIDVYKVKVYNDSVFPQNTGWEELCLIGKLKAGETRYCKRPMATGQAGLNLMMGRAQANDSYVVGSHQYINAANPTYYTRTL